MSRVGRNRKRVNNFLLSRAQTITFERQSASQECFTTSSGKTLCKNENKGTFFNRSKFIEPQNAKPTNADKLKGVQEIQPDCKTNSRGEKVCKNDKGQSINIETGTFERGKFLRFLAELPNQVGAANKKFSDDLTDAVKGENPVSLFLKAKEGVFEFILDNENKFRAAKVIADALALGAISLGTLLLATTSETGIGAVIGGGLVVGGGALKGASFAAGAGFDLVVKRIKQVKQLENAIEVARQTLTPKVDRQELIEKNSVAIDKRTEELLEMSKTELVEKSKLLEMSGVSSLGKNELAREIAIQEIIGNQGKEEVEPRVGSSLITKELEEAEEKGKAALQAREDRLIQLQLELDTIIAQEIAEIDREQDEEDDEKAEELDDDEGDDTPKGPPAPPAQGEEKEEDIDIPRGERIRQLQNQLEKETNEGRKKTIKELINKLQGLRGADTAGLDIGEEPDVIVDDSDIIEPPIVSTITTDTGKIIGEELDKIVEKAKPKPQKTSQQIKQDKIDNFNFTQVSNEDLINNTSRDKIEKAMRTDILDKPKNFNNPSRLTDEQTQGATRTTQIAKQRAAVINNNSGENIYNQIIRELTASGGCRQYLTDNIAKINLLPPNLKDELREFCESILDDDDVEEIADELP